MNIIICNTITGEVVGTNVKAGIKPLRGIIRKWMTDGLKFHQFRILEWSSVSLFMHIKEYAHEHSFSKCDLCNFSEQNKYMEYVEDNEGVCMLAYCQTCKEEMTH